MSIKGRQEEEGGTESPSPGGEQMIKPISWTEFRDSGMLFFVNNVLQFLGLSIVVEVDESTGQIDNAYPVETKFRGFTGRAAEDGYKKFTEYITGNGGNKKKDIEPPGLNPPPLQDEPKNN